MSHTPLWERRYQLCFTDEYAKVAARLGVWLEVTQSTRGRVGLGSELV